MIGRNWGLTFLHRFMVMVSPGSLGRQCDDQDPLEVATSSSFPHFADADFSSSCFWVCFLCEMDSQARMTPPWPSLQAPKCRCTRGGRLYSQAQCDRCLPTLHRAVHRQARYVSARLSSSRQRHSSEMCCPTVPSQLFRFCAPDPAKCFLSCFMLCVCGCVHFVAWLGRLSVPHVRYTATTQL